MSMFGFFTGLTGGGTYDLDNKNGGLLSDKDMAVVVTQSGFYVYSLDADSGLAESSPDVISPDDNAGDKRWILQDWKSLASQAQAEAGTDNATLMTPLRTSEAIDALGLPKGCLSGLAISNGTDSDHDIDIAVGECRDSTDTCNLALATGLTKQIDAAWAAGDDAGGLFSGAVAADTTYHVFLIQKDSDGTIDAGFDTSVTAANIPSGYTAYRRIGSVITDGSANILGFFQRGDDFWLKDPPLDINTAVLGTTAALQTLTVPGGINVVAHLNTHGYTAGSTTYIYLSDPAATDEAPANNAAPLYTLGAATYGYGTQVDVGTNTSSQIRARAGAASTTLEIVTRGWRDRRDQ